jgi:hypothetical protein
MKFSKHVSQETLNKGTLRTSKESQLLKAAQHILNLPEQSEEAFLGAKAILLLNGKG